MLSMMNQEQMTAELECLLPTESLLIRNSEGHPKLDRGVLAMLLILAKRVADLEQKAGITF